MIRAALKSLLGRKLRLVMSTFAIVLGVAFVVGTLIFSDTLNRSFTSLFASTVGDVVVRPDGSSENFGTATTRAIPGTLVDELAQVPGAARADGMVTAFGVYVIDDKGKPIGSFGTPAIGANWTDAPAGNGLEGLRIVEGEAPQGPGEVVLDATTAEKSGYDVGDRVPLTTTGEAANLEPTLVGVADFAEGGSLNGATYVAFDTAEAQRLFHDGKDEFDSVWVTAADGVSQDQLRDEVQQALPSDLEAVTGDDAADESASELLKAISFLTTFLLIFAGIALVVGSFIIVNTFSILVAQRSRELALLRALGASKRQVVRSVQLEAFVLGLLGATLGAALGIVLALGLRALFATFGLDLSGQPLVYRPRAFIAAYVVGIVVTMAAAYLPARRTSRIAPVQALRDDIALPEESMRTRFRLGLVLALLGGGLLTIGLGDYIDSREGWFTGAGVLAILLGVTAMAPVLAKPFLRAARAVYARLFGSVGNLAGQNALRNPRRTAATASALMIGLALAGTMAIVGGSAKASVDKSVEDSFTGDFVVNSVLGAPFSSSVADRINKLDGIQDVVRQRSGFADVDGSATWVIATDPSSLSRLGVTFEQGTAEDLAAPGAAMVTEAEAADRGWSVGDRFTVSTPGGEATWTLAATFKSNALLQGGMVVSVETFEAAGYPAEDTLLVIYADSGASDLQARLDDVLADQPTVTAKDQVAFAAEQREPIDQFVLIIYALLGLALLIAVLGIVNTLALSVIERTREVGLLRAIGVTRPQLRRMITLESVIIAVLGAVLGVLLGIGFGLALMQAVRDQGLEVISVPFDQLAIFMLLAVVVGVLAAILPARRAARLDVLEAIATE
ncbi:ABC transporter permease [Nocardioides sp. GXZ039]|uniref:ABC transporter permease n=1 Tax=Nocardioides sp. GXZ039 TaxID=3136018 RepID=UPI0030F475DA